MRRIAAAPAESKTMCPREAAELAMAFLGVIAVILSVSLVLLDRKEKGKDFYNKVSGDSKEFRDKFLRVCAEKFMKMAHTSAEGQSDYNAQMNLILKGVERETGINVFATLGKVPFPEDALSQESGERALDKFSGPPRKKEEKNDAGSS
jgi:hypothetical protein